ncbi:MAG TPA: cytochrome c [Pantanalinema sp.]
MDNEKAAALGKWLFFGGTAVSLAVMFFYLAPLSLSHMDKSAHIEGKPVPTDVVNGKKVFHKFVCVDCHTILGDGTQYAPDLGRIAISRDDDFLKKWVRDAHGINPNSAMPSFPAMTEQEASDLVSFLNFTSKVNLPEDLWAEMKAKKDPYDKRAYQPETNPFALSYWPPRPMNADQAAAPAAAAGQDPMVAEGQQLFHSNTVAACVTCHTVEGKGGKIGPDLSDVGAATRKSLFGTPVDAKFIETKLIDPAADSPAKTSAMPSFKALSGHQRDALVAYLRTLGH